MNVLQCFVLGGTLIRKREKREFIHRWYIWCMEYCPVLELKLFLI